MFLQIGTISRANLSVIYLSSDVPYFPPLSTSAHSRILECGSPCMHPIVTPVPLRQYTLMVSQSAPNYDGISCSCKQKKTQATIHRDPFPVNAKGLTPTTHHDTVGRPQQKALHNRQKDTENAVWHRHERHVNKPFFCLLKTINVWTMMSSFFSQSGEDCVCTCELRLAIF